MFFQLNTSFDRDSMLKVTNFFIDCKKKHSRATIMISSDGGSISALSVMLEAYKDTGIHLTAIGSGIVASCAAALFCMADERVLVPNSRLILHHSSPNVRDINFTQIPIMEKSCKASEKILVDAYLQKTSIPRKAFLSKCKNGADWYLTEAEIEKYHVTTKSPEGWTDIIANATEKK